VNIAILVSKEAKKFVIGENESGKNSIKLRLLRCIKNGNGDTAKCAMVFLTAFYWACCPRDVPALIFGETMSIKCSVDKMIFAASQKELQTNFWQLFCAAQREV